jgi:hypothetical protein
LKSAKDDDDDDDVLKVDNDEQDQHKAFLLLHMEMSFIKIEENAGLALGLASQQS